MWSCFDAVTAVASWLWPFLAQPDGLPERLIGGDPEGFVRHILRHQAGTGFEFPADSVADYLTAARDPATVHGWCEDYRAGWGIDRKHADADTGRRLPMPTLVLWGETGSLHDRDGVDLWSQWASDVRGRSLPCGHFVPEERPADVARELTKFFAQGAEDRP